MGGKLLRKIRRIVLPHTNTGETQQPKKKVKGEISISLWHDLIFLSLKVLGPLDQCFTSLLLCCVGCRMHLDKRLGDPHCDLEPGSGLHMDAFCSDLTLG